MKTKSILSMVLMLLTLGLTTLSCKKDSSSTSSNNSNDNSGVLEGAINAPFSVSEQRQVYFSKGNLQYKASTNTWRFAENQYDCIGFDNENISSTYSGWIDLFGYSTSGYNHGSVCYQPWSTSLRNSDYYPYGDATLNLYDGNGKADWGYNAISNGGNAINMWHTPSDDEMRYVFYHRETNSGLLFAKARVNGVNGVIVFPDDWQAYLFNIEEPNNRWANFSCNIIEKIDWINIFEENGAVFLPCTGERSETAVSYSSMGGTYWLSNLHYEQYGTYDCLTFTNTEFFAGIGSMYCCNGYAVRLVCDAN